MVASVCATIDHATIASTWRAMVVSSLVGITRISIRTRIETDQAGIAVIGFRVEFETQPCNVTGCRSGRALWPRARRCLR